MRVPSDCHDSGGFRLWMSKVNAIIASRLCGLTSDDLPDWNYRDAYDEGTTPSRAAAQAMRAAKDY